jgi:cytosol alanyl aminopeptidase
MANFRKSLIVFLTICFFTYPTTSQAQDKPTLRLPESVAPTSYRVELTLDPAKETFSGVVSIQLDVKQPVKAIWLNATDISVADASLNIGGQMLNAKAAASGVDFLELDFPSELPTSKGELTIHYTGKVRQQSSSGIFGMLDNGNKYIYTQFEATDARAAFPCFDEPSYKVPWQLTLHVPVADTAVSNTPIDQERTEGSDKTYVFKQTKPLPSYLVAFAVGPLEYVDAGKAGKNRYPVRIVVPKGHANEAKYAAEVTATILTRLEDYFGIPFPYDKSDQVSIPTTAGFGAMENPGMVTYAQTLILAEPARDTINRQRGYVSVAAHELAHQWFGDLVTTAWWNDIWLNEAFATWMEEKLVAEWKPEWKTRVEDVYSKLYAEREDSLVSARKIRQEIERKEDIGNAFDGITYEKGAAVIGMFESYLGAAEFRKGVQGYLKQYAFRNATAPEFLDAISSSTKRDVTKAFSTFLNQAGVPVVEASLDCRQDSAVLHLEQHRSLPLGTKTQEPQTWKIPVCVRYPAGETQRSCTLVDQPKQDLQLKGKGCPAWVQMNDNAVGYYQVDYQGDLLRKAESAEAVASLSSAERLDFIGNVQSGVAAGRLQFAEELQLVELFHPDSERNVVEATLGIVTQPAGGGPVPKQWAPANLETNYKHFVARNFGERARQIGWIPKGGETDDVRLLRPMLLGLVASSGGDQELAKQGRELAEKWFGDHASIDANMVNAVLRTAAFYGDKSLMDRYIAESKKTTDRQIRQSLQRAMLYFRDPAAVSEALRAVTAGDVPLMEGGGTVLVFAGQISHATNKMAFDFIKAHYDEIMAKRPVGISDFGGFLPQSGVSFCDAQSKAELKSFFEPLLDKVPGARHSLDQVLEGIDVCIATHAAESASIEGFLRKY